MTFLTYRFFVVRCCVAFPFRPLPVILSNTHKFFVVTRETGHFIPVVYILRHCLSLVQTRTVSFGMEKGVGGNEEASRVRGGAGTAAKQKFGLKRGAGLPPPEP